MRELIAELLPEQPMQMWVPQSELESESTALNEVCHMSRLYLQVDQQHASITLERLQYSNFWMGDLTTYKAILVPFDEFPFTRETKKVVFKTNYVALDERQIHKLPEEAGIETTVVSLQPHDSRGYARTILG